MIFFQPPDRKLHFFSLSIVFLSLFCFAQPHTGDTTQMRAAPMKDLNKRDVADSVAAKKTAAAADTIGSSAKSPSDTAPAPKKSGDLTDTVFYGTEGGYIDYDVDKKTMHLVHNAMVRYQNLTLYADTIVYRIDDALFEASGKPQLVEGGDTTIGEAMIYNIKTRRGRVRYASTHMNDAYFNGRQIIKSPANELYIDQGDYTTCAYVEEPHYFFYGKNIKLIPDDKIICRPVVLAIGGAPVGVLPFIWFPIQKNRKSGLLTPIWGGHPESGGYIDNLGYYWAFNDYSDLSLSARVQDFQEFVFNGASNYCKKYQLNGNISGHYTYNGNFQQRNQQWSLNYSHNQILIPDGSLTLAGSGNLVSDQSFYRNFSENDTELLNQSIRANMSLSKRFESINASGNITWDRQQNLSTNDIVDNLPSLSFSLPSRSLFPTVNNENAGATGKSDEPAWYNKLTYSYSAQALQKIHRGPTDSLSDNQKEIAQGLNLSAPLTLLKWFTVNPNFSANLYTFDKYQDTVPIRIDTVQDTTFDTLQQKPTDTSRIVQTMSVFDYSTNDTVYTYKHVTAINPRIVPRYLTHDRWTNNYGWNAGVGLSTTLYGVYPIPVFNFVGIRHILRPSIDYRYTPKHDLDKKYNAILGNDGPHDKSKTVSLSLQNEFQGKTSLPAKTPGEKPIEKKFQILSASLSTGYNFEAKGQKWQNLGVNASTGYSVFRLSYTSDFWLYNLQNQLSPPLLHSYSVTVSPNALSARGTLWEGDKIVANGLYPKDDPLYHNAGPQQWQFTLGPSYSYSRSRPTLSDPFVETKNYSLNASASLNFSRKWSMSWSSYYNFVTSQLVGNNLHFHCDLECWDMVFDYQPTGSFNAGYYFKVNIKKIPEIFWEKRD
jgi:lipopolysaccharide assembly outer membrane protein LptD (OstA)